MKKVLLVFLVFFVASLIYSCCKEITYKTTLTGLQYVGKGFESDESDTIFVSEESTLLMSFKIDNDFTEIAMGSFIPGSMAKGGEDCNDYTYERYEDPITELFFGCNKDLSEIDANQNFPDYSFGVRYQSPYEVIYHERNSIIDLLNGNTAKGNAMWISVSTNQFVSGGHHKFTVRFKTQSGKLVEATTKDFWVVL